LILGKIIQIVATGCHTLRLNLISAKAPDRAEGASSTFQTSLI